MFSYKFAAYFQNTFSLEQLWMATSDRYTSERIKYYQREQL